LTAPGAGGNEEAARAAPGRPEAVKVILEVEAEDLGGLRTWDQFSEKLTALVDAGFPEVIVDFGAARGVSSLALGTVVACHRKMTSVGRRLAVKNVSEELRLFLGRANVLGSLEEK